MEVIMAVITYFSGTWGMLELVGSIFSIICVYLATKHNKWTWFWGALGVICFGVLFFQFQLYSDMALQILFFLPMQVWGYMKWNELSAQSNISNVTLSTNPMTNWLIIASIALLTLINGLGMATYTDASFPFADAWTTWMSVFAQILMIRKYWQSWVLWIVMDIGAIYIYFAKGLFVVSGLYGLFLVIATIGLVKWYRDWKSLQVPPVLSEKELFVFSTLLTGDKTSLQSKYNI
jgi:nicotinamide mononucleotide transporter